MTGSEPREVRESPKSAADFAGIRSLNNRAENSHQPTRRREQQMKRFKAAEQALQSLSARDRIANLTGCTLDGLTKK